MFNYSDICEGSMRAVLQLFYCLSQFKVKGQHCSYCVCEYEVYACYVAPEGSADHPHHPPSRISRPISPSPRMTHSVHSSVPHPTSSTTSHSVPISNHSSVKSQGNLPTSPLSPPSGTGSSDSLLPSSTASKEGSVHPSGSTLKSRPSQRRTAGSTIPTGMDFMGNQRRVQYKNVNVLQDDSKPSEGRKEQSPPVTLAPPMSSTPPSSSRLLSSAGSPQSSGLKLPEGSGSGLKQPISNLKSPDGSPGIRPTTCGLKAPTNLQSLKSPNTESSTTSVASKPLEPTEKDSSSESKLKMIPATKAQRSLSMGRSVTPSTSKLMKQSSMTNAGESLVTSGGSGRPSLTGAGGGRLQPSGGSDVKKVEKKDGDPEGNELTSVTKSKTLDYKSGLLGPSSGLQGPSTGLHGPNRSLQGPGSGIQGPSTGLQGPSKIGGGKSSYQNVKLAHRDSDKSLGHTSGIKPVDKKERSPEPERSSSVGSISKPGKRLQMSQLSRQKPTGSPPLRQTSEPSQRADPRSISDSSECLSDNETKPVSKLALITQRQSQSPILATSKPPNESLNEKTPDPLTTTDPVTAPNPAPVSERVMEPSKTTVPPPLDIAPTIDTTAPSKADNRSSGSSIGSFSSSLNSQSESSILDIQTPSPTGSRKYVRRTSPEGMSVDETASPRDMNKLSDLSNEESKEEVFSLMSSGEDLQKDKDNLIAVEAGMSSKVKRAQSLSPKASRRILPMQGQAVMPTRSPVVNTGKTSSRGSYDNVHNNTKPRSVLRTPRQPGDHLRTGGKHVTISPHSSVESFSSSDNSLIHLNSSMEEKHERIPKRPSQSERPKSLEDIEAHQFSIAGYPGDLHPHLLSNNLARRGSTRSEKLDYSDESLMREKLMDEARGKNATPEVVSTSM